jgi:cation diffusion facilitator family transporter
VEIEGIGIGFVVMLVSALVNILVSRRLYKVAKEEHSVALEADALHLKADVITSLGVGVGLMAIWILQLLGIRAILGLHVTMLDPIVAIAVAVFITKEAIGMLLRAFRPLVDASLPADDHALIEEVIAKYRPEGSAFHQLRTRMAGKHRHIDFHLNLPAGMTVAESHRICDQIEDELENRLSHTIVVIHVEPEGHA